VESCLRSDCPPRHGESDGWRPDHAVVFYGRFVQVAYDAHFVELEFVFESLQTYTATATAHVGMTRALSSHPVMVRLLRCGSRQRVGSGMPYA
jgi:hypothetical protein